MHPLGTKVYLLKRYRPSDSFCTFFFSESVVQNMNILIIVSLCYLMLRNGTLILCFTTAVKPSMFKELLDYANVDYWISSWSLLGKAPHLLLLPFFFLVFSRQKINNNNCYY